MSGPTIAIAWPKPDYIASLEAAGAVVRTLDPEKDVLPAALAGCDGVLLTGGADVDPSEYGETDRHPTLWLAPERDAYELALTRAALERDMPLLAICRGAQVLNVAAGGSLVQDIPSERHTSIQHSIEQPKDSLAHGVNVTPGTCLAVLLHDQRGGRAQFDVNSRHHQSVKDTAPGFVVSATAPDGIVEAIEKPDARFCLGVQWHPENFWRDGRFAALFTGLIEAAARYRSAR